jgi:hypothetical protein
VSRCCALPNTRSYDEAWAASDALEAIGWVPEPVIEDLAEMLRKHDHPGWATRILSAVGPIYTEPVIEALKRNDKRSREFAAAVLGNYGPAAKEAAPTLRDYVQNEKDNVRLWSAVGLGLAGLTAPLVTDGARTGDLLVADVEQVLVPALVAGAGVIVDNLSSHKRARVRELIEAAGCTLRFLPP